MKRYQAILFDLFDTLIDLNDEKYPLVRIGQKERRSTGGVIYQAFRAFYDGIGFEEFFQAFVAVSREVDAVRLQNHREILSQERFRRLLQRLGIESPPTSLVEKLVSVHMNQMFQAMEFPPERRFVLDALNPHYSLAVVSNFDHPPTVYRVLDHYGLTSYFKKIIISGEVGWRKPGREIFLAALTALDARAEESLHVGDAPEADVLGAKQIGLPVAWVNRLGQPLPEDIPHPDYTITQLGELLPILI